ncbi:MAG: beta-ketoacyl synthase chain length factor [Pseudomonadota bacterium]
MKIDVLGAGVWARNLTGVSALQALLTGTPANPQIAFEAPRPEAIAARERRRAGLMINLAVTVAHEACERSELPVAQPGSVFTSAMGDTAITDYMCRKLAAPEKLLSPTKFHNSVHNAPSGYWTISAGNRAPSSFVGGFRESFGAGLLEAASQALAAQEPILLVASDIACETPFDSIEPVRESLGLAIVLAPAGWRAQGPVLTRATLTFAATERPDAQAPQHPWLAALAEANPSGAGLALLERLYTQEQAPADSTESVRTPQRAPLKIKAAPEAQLTVEFEAVP